MTVTTHVRDARHVQSVCPGTAPLRASRMAGGEYVSEVASTTSGAACLGVLAKVVELKDGFWEGQVERL